MARRQDSDETEPLTADEKFNRLVDLLTLQAQAATPLNAETLRDILTESQKVAAGAMRKAMKPENETHPHISAFSYPEGDIAHPKATMPFEFYYNAYPCHKFPETEHWREWELMLQVQPGEYTVLRKDFTKMSVKVEGERDADNKITKLTVTFPVSREDKGLVPPKSVVLYQIVYPDNPRKRFVEAMQEHLTLTLGEVTA